MSKATEQTFVETLIPKPSVEGILYRFSRRDVMPFAAEILLPDEHAFEGVIDPVSDGRTAIAARP